jgi:hypothetical protein
VLHLLLKKASQGRGKVERKRIWAKNCFSVEMGEFLKLMVVLIEEQCLLFTLVASHEKSRLGE